METTTESSLDLGLDLLLANAICAPWWAVCLRLPLLCIPMCGGTKRKGTLHTSTVVISIVTCILHLPTRDEECHFNKIT